MLTLFYLSSIFYIYICISFIFFFFFFNDTATTEIYTLSLHDALPISRLVGMSFAFGNEAVYLPLAHEYPAAPQQIDFGTDRKSTRLNSSHSQISYAVFCLKKKKKIHKKSIYTHTHKTLNINIRV